MRHDYHARKERRKNHFESQAAKNDAAADAHRDAADKIGSYIPPGQPILVGHHSEKRHRRDLEKIDSHMVRARTADEKAEYYRNAVQAMDSNTAISSDDPDAIEKLEQKVEILTNLQEFMKEANKCIRKKDKAKFLTLPFATEDLWIRLNVPDCFKCTGFAIYRLKNNNANIRRYRLRLDDLRKRRAMKTTENIIKGVRVVENVEANRIQLFFPAKPSQAVRDRLSDLGFHWSPSEGDPWQRMLSNAGVFAAKQFLEFYEKE